MAKGRREVLSADMNGRTKTSPVGPLLRHARLAAYGTGSQQDQDTLARHRHPAHALALGLLTYFSSLL